MNSLVLLFFSFETQADINFWWFVAWIVMIFGFSFLVYKLKSVILAIIVALIILLFVPPEIVHFTLKMLGR